METEATDVIVIGAGIAGLTAARALAEAGKRVAVLEAQARIGGRILTVESPTTGLPVELGAEFVHGEPEDLLALIREAGLHTFELDGDDMCWVAGGEAGPGRIERCKQDAAFAIVEELKEYSGQDLSFAEYLRGKETGGRTRERAIGYVEGFNAADAEEISVLALGRQQRAEDASGGERVSRVREGYGRLAEHQRARMESAGALLHLRAAATEVRWSAGDVVVRTRAGETFRARQLVLAVPLGVLQAKSISLVPEPAAAMQASALLAMGPVGRVVLVFRERVWAAADPGLAKLSFLFAERGTPGTWWTPYPEAAVTLTGWVGGRKAAAVKGGEQFKIRALQQLSEYLAMPPGRLEEALAGAHTHDWQSDEWSRGAYSYVRVGGADASAAMAEPIAGTLFFAGEHTDLTGHWGTVHGAMRSGARAAAQVLGSTGEGVARLPL